MNKLSIINDQIEALTEELNYHIDLNIRHEDLLDRLAGQKALFQHYRQNHQRLMVVAEMYEMVLCSPDLAETHFYEQYVQHITKYQSQIIQPADVHLPYHKFIKKPKTRSIHQLTPVARIQAKYRHACRKMVQRIRYTPSRTEDEAQIRLEVLRSRAEFMSPLIPKFASQVSRLEQDVKRLEDKVKIFRARVAARESEKILRAFVAEYQVMAANTFNEMKQQYIMSLVSQHSPRTATGSNLMLPATTKCHQMEQYLYRSTQAICHDPFSSSSAHSNSIDTAATSYSPAFDANTDRLSRKIPLHHPYDSEH